MATYQLTIQLTPGGIVIYNGDQVANSLEVDPGDTVNFTSPLAWAVQFIAEGRPHHPGRKRPPLNTTAQSGAANSEGGFQVQNSARRGDIWDYVACVVDSSGNLHTVDPDIVIGSRPL